MEDHIAYDYRMYDNVWQRVSPGCDPYGDRADPPAAPPRSDGITLPTPQLPAVRSEETLPGAQADPCCMGSAAMESLAVLEGFIEAELAQCRCFRALATRLCQPDAARLLRTLGTEKTHSVRELKAAYFLITGSCYESTVSVSHMRWNSAAEALRACYHREACSGFNFRRAADETTDLCLQKLFTRLSAHAFAGADSLMALLGHLLC